MSIAPDAPVDRHNVGSERRTIELSTTSSWQRLAV